MTWHRSDADGFVEAAHAAAAAIAVAVAILATVVLTGGWILGVEALRRLRPDYASMVPSTAVSFLAISGAVLAIVRAWPPALASVLLAVVSLVALIDLGVLLTGVAGTVDAIINPAFDTGGGEGMAPATAICFLLAASSVYGLRRDDYPGLTLYVWCATAGLLSAMTAVVGYTYDASALYELSIFSAMALHTALGFILTFTAVLLLRPEIGWVGVITGHGAGSAGTRRLLPVVILIPFTLCYAALVVTDVGLFSANFRLSLIAIAMMTMFAASVLRNAMLENATEQELRSLADRLGATVRQRDMLLREVYHRVKNNLQQINALLQLESSRLADPSAKAAMHATARRVTALGAAQRRLMADDVPSQVRSIELLRDVTPDARSEESSQEVRPAVEVEADDFLIHVDLAAVLGLLVNELATRMTEHAPPARWTEPLRLKLLQSPSGDLVLTIARAGGNDSVSDGLGSPSSDRIVHGIVGQLNARLAPLDDQGVSGVQVTVPAATVQQFGGP